MFNDLFVQLLQENNITAYKLSKDTGITEGLISQWKSGRQLPGYDNIKVLSDYFNISADYFFERKKKSDCFKVLSDFSDLFDYKDARKRYASYIYQAIINLQTNNDLLYDISMRRYTSKQNNWVVVFKYCAVSLCECAKIISIDFLSGKQSKDDASHLLYSRKHKMYTYILNELISLSSQQNELNKQLLIFNNLWETNKQFFKAVRNITVHFDNEKNGYAENTISALTREYLLFDANNNFIFNIANDWSINYIEKIYTDIYGDNKSIADSCTKLFSELCRCVLFILCKLWSTYIEQFADIFNESDEQIIKARKGIKIIDASQFNDVKITEESIVSDSAVAENISDADKKN